MLATLATLPWGVGRTTTDTLTFASLVATTLAIALLAPYVAARRSLAVAPIHALKAERAPARNCTVCVWRVTAAGRLGRNLMP